MFSVDGASTVDIFALSLSTIDADVLVWRDHDIATRMAYAPLKQVGDIPSMLEYFFRVLYLYV